MGACTSTKQKKYEITRTLMPYKWIYIYLQLEFI